MTYSQDDIPGIPGLIEIPDLTAEERTSMERLLEAHAKDLHRALQQIERGEAVEVARQVRDAIPTKPGVDGVLASFMEEGIDIYPEPEASLKDLFN